MKGARPEQLAVRAVNQYRRRDVVPFLGLRYYFANRCALRDRWAGDVASHLVVSRSAPIYFHALHFKDHYEGKQVEHRNIHLPGPNEAFAEAALLDACARHPNAFDARPCTFSYRLARGACKDGMFEPYFAGFRERHRAVAEACMSESGGIVLYTDIKQFYPTISAALARSAWKRACDAASMNQRMRELGEKILLDHERVAQSLENCAGLLTGPMFSHLLGNLILRDVDERMHAAMPGRYFRYVDDMILTGTESQVSTGRNMLAQLLQNLNLHLHDSVKDFRVSAEDWLKGEDDFADDGRKPSWVTFIGELKHLLVVKPESRGPLMNAFAAEGMRIPVPDYSGAAMEATRLERLVELAKNAWFRRKVWNITVEGLVREAITLRARFATQLREQLAGTEHLHGYSRKRRIPKLRFLAGRLMYLGKSETLSELGALLRAVPELCLLGEVFKAVAMQDVTDLVPLGSNAVQSAAQVLRFTGGPVRCQPLAWQAVEAQGLAIMRLNGVTVDLGGAVNVPNDELNRFALWNEGGAELMRSKDQFIRELSCLHGVSDGPRHSVHLDSAFDRDEQLAFDAINQLQESSYF